MSLGKCEILTYFTNWAFRRSKIKEENNLSLTYLLFRVGFPKFSFSEVS
jgi:hypothetical protein